MKRIVYLFFYSFVLLFLPSVTLAGPILHDLDMTVRLADNGDARITEVRRMHIDSEGTECYIVIGNLGQSEVTDLTVTDETGRRFDNIGSWDIDASRSRKAGRCGYVYKSNGYELCWGLGDEGERTYIVSYTVTRLVHGYDDADGFNFMFVAQNIKPLAQHAKITFEREDGEDIPQDVVRMWAFRYNGDVQWRDGKVVAETATAMTGNEAMIVMLRFDKGFLNPEIVEQGSFDQLKDKAFVNSDYSDSDSDLGAIICLLLGIAAIILSPFIIAFYFIRVWYYRNQAKKNLLWFRGLPYNGDLKKTYEVLNAYSWINYDSKNLLSALVLKLISIKALAIEEHWVQPTGFRKLTGGQPKLTKLLAVKELHIDEKTPNRFLLSRLFGIFNDAAGDDNLLQPNELRNWIKNHSTSAETLMTNMKSSRSLGTCSKDMKNVRDVLGMKLFLEDFTLANQRHATEVALWKDYLVYAELFGIAKQVRKDMVQANPEYLKMDEVLKQLNDHDVLPAITYATLAGFHDVKRASAAASAGRGGWASSGGGGGFSGGGCGGGVR